jgi:hypothetical protein
LAAYRATNAPGRKALRGLLEKMVQDSTSHACVADQAAESITSHRER